MKKKLYQGHMSKKHIYMIFVDHNGLCHFIFIRNVTATLMHKQSYKYSWRVMWYQIQNTLL